ncbi:MAG: Protein YrdA [Elusimicrobia bacterium]|nr:Protein YrdA [Elusimicrobiota bacterium]
MIFSIGSIQPDIHPTAFIHPTAEISGKVKIGARVSIWGGCILRGDVDWIEIGEDSNIQDGSVFHTSPLMPVHLGKGVTVGHRAIVHGAVVRDYSLIGMGAILLDKSLIETNCLIGAGAIVKEGGVIPAGSLALGIPAKVMRPLKAEEIKMIVERAEEYVQLASQYRNALKTAALI